jgi:hypothetical protein
MDEKTGTKRPLEIEEKVFDNIPVIFYAFNSQRKYTKTVHDSLVSKYGEGQTLLYMIKFSSTDVVKKCFDIIGKKFIDFEEPTDGTTPLMNACVRGDHDLCLFFIENGAKTDNYVDSGENLFDMVIRTKVEKIVDAKKIIDLLIKINLHAEKPCRFLINACFAARYDIVEHLLTNHREKIDVNFKSYAGLTALDAACMSTKLKTKKDCQNVVNICKILIKNGGTTSKNWYNQQVKYGTNDPRICVHNIYRSDILEMLRNRRF